MDSMSPAGRLRLRTASALGRVIGLTPGRFGLAAKFRSRRLLAALVGRPTPGEVIDVTVGPSSHRVALRTPKSDKHIPMWMLGIYERPVTDVVTSQVPANGTVLDVGGHLGYFTLLAAHQTNGAGRVLAFEPIADNAASIRASADLNGFDHVEVIEFAASDRIGVDSISIPCGSEAPSVGRIGAPDDGDEVIDIRTTTIDATLAEHPVASIDLIKVDVEGHELEALRGAQRTIERHQPKVIVEILHTERQELDELLRELGYSSTTLAKREAQHFVLAEAQR